MAGRVDEGIAGLGRTAASLEQIESAIRPLLAQLTEASARFRTDNAGAHHVARVA